MSLLINHSARTEAAVHSLKITQTPLLNAKTAKRRQQPFVTLCARAQKKSLNNERVAYFHFSAQSRKTEHLGWSKLFRRRLKRMRASLFEKGELRAASMRGCVFAQDAESPLGEMNNEEF